MKTQSTLSIETPRGAARLTRRRAIGAGLALGATSVLGGAACATPVVDDGSSPAAHPLSGLLDFRGAPIAAPTLKGNVTVLDFWASWCAPCRQAFRYLDQLYRTYQSRGVRMLAISMDEEARNGMSFVARMRPRFDVAWDRDGVVGGRFGVSSLPTTVLLDRDANLVHRHAGFEPRLHQLLESHVRRLVDGL